MISYAIVASQSFCIFCSIIRQIYSISIAVRSVTPVPLIPTTLHILKSYACEAATSIKCTQPSMVVTLFGMVTSVRAVQL